MVKHSPKILVSEEKATTTHHHTTTVRHKSVEGHVSTVADSWSLGHVQNATRQHIVKLLLQCLQASAPNLAHWLLGFQIQKSISKTNLQDPGRPSGRYLISRILLASFCGLFWFCLRIKMLILPTSHEDYRSKHHTLEYSRIEVLLYAVLQKQV